MVLINTCTQEAFGGIFEALDLLDEQPTEVEGLGTSGRSFVYEWTLRPDYRLNTKNTKRILGCIKQRQKVLMQMDISSLSPKNQELVRRILAFRHTRIDYSDDPIFGTNVVEVVAETNTAEQAVEATVITNLVVETVKLKSPVEDNKNDVEDIVMVDEEPAPKSKILITFIIAIVAIVIVGIIMFKRKNH